MELPSPVSEELAELLAARFHLLAEPMRVRLVERLRKDEATASQLSGELHSSQQNVSKHLALLADAGILSRRKDANCVYYRIDDETAIVLCERVCDSLAERRGNLAELVARPAALGLERSPS